jgi:hypothetical protein
MFKNKQECVSWLWADDDPSTDPNSTKSKENEWQTVVSRKRLRQQRKAEVQGWYDLGSVDHHCSTFDVDYVDTEVKCKTCGEMFVFTAEEQAKYATLNFPMRKTCVQCKKEQKND